MSQDASSFLQAGREAIKRNAWREAFDHLIAADRSAPLSPEDLEGLGEAASSRRTSRTFMFTDIVKSTNLIEAIGDEAWADLLRWHDHTLRSLFAQHRGQEIDHTGDGFFVAFEDATTAVECAVAIQRSLTGHRRKQGFAPQVRIGLHAAAAAYSGTGYRGKGVHEAARIAALAEGEEILASRETAGAALTRFATSEPRTVSLKGLSEPVQLVTIDWR